jgi:hypothetical protein
MSVLAHDGGHLVIVMIGLMVAGVVALVAWFKER